MGNREALLEGAKTCLRDKGYAKTTARDIAAASGVSLAAIGYHFGSMDTLLTAALIEAVGDWSDEMERAMAGDVDPTATPLQRLESALTRLVESVGEHRPLWVANFEVFTAAERTPQLRELLAAAQQEGRRGCAALLLGIPEDEVDEAALALGALHMTLIGGLISQWLISPEHAPHPAALVRAMRTLAATG